METKKRIHEIGQVIIVAETYILHNGKVLMHKRAETKKRFPGFWAGPGGQVDEGEDALTAALREVKEEAGVLINEADVSLKAIAIHHHLDLQEVCLCFVFLASIPTDQKVVSKEDEGHSEWLALTELKKMENIFPPARFYFDHVFNNKPGIMYTNIQWENSRLVKVLSQRVDKDK